MSFSTTWVPNGQLVGFHVFFPMYLIAIGAVPSPFDCYLVNRGLKTLALRMQAHMKSSLEIARWLEANPRVERVIHPGN